MKLLITGAAGQLGSTFVDRGAPHHEVVGLARAQLDLTDAPAVLAHVQAVRPDVIVNCGAYNDVDGAESEPVTALAVNAIAVRTLARASAEVGATLVHFSTDFVFDGTGSKPYTEDDAPNPRSAYACSKLLGEWFARDAPRHYVLRVESLFGGATRRSSVDTIVDSLRSGREARVFVDRTVSPSYVDDVVAATLALVERRVPSGLFHCVNSGSVTWFGLAEFVAGLLGVEPRLVPVRVADTPLPAARPQYCALSNRRLADLGIGMPSWQDALTRHVTRLEGEPPWSA